MRKALLLPLLLAAHLGCGTSCPEIVAHREAFSRHLMDTRPVARGPDLRLSLPWPIVDSLLADAVTANATPIALTPPGLASLELSARLIGARAHAPERNDKEGLVGLTLELALEQKGARVLILELKTGLVPALVRTPEPGIRLALAAEALDEVVPKTTPEGRQTLSRWLERELPPAMKIFGAREVVDALADQLLGWAAHEAWPLVRRALPDGDLFSTVVALPELERIGARALTTEAQSGALVFGLTTGAAAPPLAPSRANPKRITLTMTGPTATALISRAMDRGEVPGRFSSKGEPDPKGPWEARVGWLGGNRPLHLQMWRVQGGCERAEVAAQIALNVEGDELAVDVREGKLITLAGPAFAEAFAWLETLFGKALAFSFRTAALLSLPTEQPGSAGLGQGTLRLTRAHIADTVTFELELTR